MFVTPRSSSSRPPFLNASVAGRRSLQTTPRTTPKRCVEQVIQETSDHVVSAINTPVPVQVQEALQASRECQVRLDRSGWAWLVADGKLVLWCYTSQQVTAQCVRVSLPPTRPGRDWLTRLITVDSNSTESKVPVLGVSPTGQLFYWTNILRESSVTSEGTIPLGEGVAFSVSHLPGPRFIVTSTMATLYTVQTSDSQLGVAELQLSRGVLSGISRRVSSLFFRGGATVPQDTRRLLVGAGGQVLLLTDSHLQRWQLDQESLELVYNTDLRGVISDSLSLNQWVEPLAQAPPIMLVDTAITRANVFVLFAVINETSSTAEFGLAFFPLNSQEEPSQDVDNVIRLNYTTRYNNGGSGLLQYSLLGSANTVAMYSNHTLLLVNVSRTPAGLPDMTNFPLPNLVLGSGHSQTGLVLFTLQQGVVMITTPTQPRPNPALTTPGLRQVLVTTPNPSPLVRAIGIVAPEVSQESTEVLKTAFSEYLEGNLTEVERICDENFPSSSFTRGLDTPGDLGVVGLSLLIMDDLPVSSDTSWSEGAETPGGKSLILIYRLEQKLMAHNKYLSFLTDSGLLERLTRVTVRGCGLNTRTLLCEHAEKIHSAVSVRKVHTQVTDQLIRLAVRGRTPSPLSKTDQFYTELSLFESILTAIPQLLGEQLPLLQANHDRVELILETSALLLSVLRDAEQYRQANAHMYHTSPTPRDGPPPNEEVYWTSCDQVRSVLREQTQILLSVCIREALEQDRKRVWSLLVGLSDMLFEGYKVQLQSLPPEGSRRNELQKTFETDRGDILASLVAAEQYGHAAELAEKFADFKILVQLCELMGTKWKLQDYMETYKSQGFADFLFKWYLDEGRLQELVSLSATFPTELKDFLKPHPHLSWLHALNHSKYYEAFESLKTLSDKETKYVAKKKTLLSLGKLSLLAASGRERELSVVNNQLEQIEYQQAVPDLEDHDLDPLLMPPLPTRDVIEMYVDDRASENEFISALELVDIACPDKGSDEAAQLRGYIWSQAILRNDWSQLNVDNPLGELRKTFYSLVLSTAYNKGLDVLALLPELPLLLTHPSLAERGVAQDPVLRFLLSASYEQLERVAVSRRAGLEQETGQEKMES